MYLVTGAAGHVGGAVARQLREQGHSVRALVRDPSGAAGLPAGIELAAGDLDDPDSVAKAVQGVEAIFLMHVGTGTEQTTTMIAAAQDAEVPRIVLLSSAVARLLPLDDNPMGAAFAAREQILRESGLGATLLFDRRVEHVADPGHVAAQQLDLEAGGDQLGQRFGEASPERSQAEHGAQAAIQRGTPPEQARLMERLNEVFRARRSVNITDDVENITGTAPRPSGTGANATPAHSAEPHLASHRR
jgi:NAD(P)-dependent dehydrogenase (short-subunit alcohol dehydrogenase family)